MAESTVTVRDTIAGRLDKRFAVGLRISTVGIWRRIHSSFTSIQIWCCAIHPAPVRFALRRQMPAWRSLPAWVMSLGSVFRKRSHRDQNLKTRPDAPLSGRRRRRSQPRQSLGLRCLIAGSSAACSASVGRNHMTANDPSCRWSDGGLRREAEIRGVQISPPTPW